MKYVAIAGILFKTSYLGKSVQGKLKVGLLGI